MIKSITCVCIQNYDENHYFVKMNMTLTKKNVVTLCTSRTKSTFKRFDQRQRNIRDRTKSGIQDS